MPDFDPTTDAAIDVVAHHLLRAALESETYDGGWEMYPDISQNVFEEVERRAAQMAGAWPDKAVYDAAYAHLEKLAQEHPAED